MFPFSSNLNLSILDDIMNFFKNLIYAISRRALCGIYEIFICSISRLCDLCQLIFRKFAGISEYAVTVDTPVGNNFSNNQGQNDIIFNLLSSRIVQNVFFSLLALAIILLLVTTFVANIKAEWNAEKSGNRKTVIKNAFKGLLNFVAVPVISLAGIMISNGLLKAVDGATNIAGNQTYISGQIFMACAYSSNRVRMSEDNSDAGGLGKYRSGSFGELITTEYGNFGIFVDDDAGSGGYRAAEKIDQAFVNGMRINFKKQSVLIGDSQQNIAISGNKNANKLYYGGRLDFWYLGLNITYPYSYLGVIVDVYANQGIQYGSDTFEQPVINFSMYDVGIVSYYYDLMSFDYLLFLVVSIICMWILISTAVGLIKRMFMLVLLFVISPPVCAMYPIDEGKALGKWRTEFVKSLLSAYAVVVVMNLFLTLLPLFTKINVFSSADSAARLGEMWPFIYREALGMDNWRMPEVVINATNNNIRMFIILGSLFFIKGAISTIANIFNFGNAYEDGSAVTKQIGKTVAGAAALAVGLPPVVAAGLARSNATKAGVSAMGAKPAGQASGGAAGGASGGAAGGVPGGSGEGAGPTPGAGRAVQPDRAFGFNPQGGQGNGGGAGGSGGAGASGGGGIRRDETPPLQPVPIPPQPEASFEAKERGKKARDAYLKKSAFADGGVFGAMLKKSKQISAVTSTVYGALFGGVGFSKTLGGLSDISKSVDENYKSDERFVLTAEEENAKKQREKEQEEAKKQKEAEMARQEAIQKKKQKMDLLQKELAELQNQLEQVEKSHQRLTHIRKAQRTQEMQNEINALKVKGEQIKIQMAAKQSEINLLMSESEN